MVTFYTLQKKNKKKTTKKQKKKNGDSYANALNCTTVLIKSDPFSYFNGRKRTNCLKTFILVIMIYLCIWNFFFANLRDINARMLHTKFDQNTSSQNPFNPLQTGRLFHCYMLGESFCHFTHVEYIILIYLLYFLWKILLANNVDPDQTPHYVASDLGLHCLAITLLRVSR